MNDLRLQVEGDLDYYIIKHLHRNRYIDFIRGVAIFLMLWGHSIQYCIPPGIDFFENSVFKFIYTFHMPIFAMISGYMFGISLNRKAFSDCLSNRIVGLTQSIVFGGLLHFVIVNFPKMIFYQDISMLISGSVLYTSESFWFLWSIIGATIAVATAIKLAKSICGRLLILCALTPFMLALPNGELNVYMCPYFVLGWWYSEYKENVTVKLLYKIRYICLLMFIIMLFFYEKKHYIYTTGLLGGENFIDSIEIDLFRYAIGFFGCVFTLLIGEWLMKFANKINLSKVIFVDSLSAVGSKSLQMYILSCSLLSVYLPNIAKYIYNVGLFKNGINIIMYNAVITPSIALAYTSAIYWIVKLMEKVKISKLIFGR